MIRTEEVRPIEDSGFEVTVWTAALGARICFTTTPKRFTSCACVEFTASSTCNIGKLSILRGIKGSGIQIASCTCDFTWISGAATDKEGSIPASPPCTSRGARRGKVLTDNKTIRHDMRRELWKRQYGVLPSTQQGIKRNPA